MSTLPQDDVYDILAEPDSAKDIAMAKRKDMTAKELARALEHLKLSVYASAYPHGQRDPRSVLGLSLRQMQRVVAGEASVPRPVAKLITLMLKRKITVEDAIEAG